MTNSNYSVIAVQDTPEEISLVGGVLEDAFTGDPISDIFYEYVKPEKRKEVARKEKEAMVKCALNNGSVYQSENFKAVAVWWAPGQNMLSPYNLLFGGILSVMWHGGFDLIKGMKEWIDVAEAAKKRILKERPHYFLLYLATGSEHQRKGYGSALLRSLLAKADAEEMPCYLEATKVSLVPYYQAFGFDMVEEVKLNFGLTNGHVSCYCMLREPKKNSDEVQDKPIPYATL